MEGNELQKLLEMFVADCYRNLHGLGRRISVSRPAVNVQRLAFSRRDRSLLFWGRAILLISIALMVMDASMNLAVFASCIGIVFIVLGRWRMIYEDKIGECVEPPDEVVKVAPVIVHKDMPKELENDEVNLIKYLWNAVRENDHEIVVQQLKKAKESTILSSWAHIQIMQKHFGIT